MVHLSPGGLPTRVLSKSKAPGVDSPKPQQMSRKCFEHDRSQLEPTSFHLHSGAKSAGEISAHAHIGKEQSSRWHTLPTLGNYQY